MCRPF